MTQAPALTIFKPWEKFDPREQMNELFNKYNFPHFVSYTCVVNSPEVFDTRITIVVMDSPATELKPIVLLQFAEQYNGDYDSYIYDSLPDDDESGLSTFAKLKVEEVLKEFTY